MIVDRKEPRPPSYQSEVIGEPQGYLAHDGTKSQTAQDHKFGFADSTASSGTHPHSPSEYSSSYNAMGSRDGDSKDDPFHPPPGSSYLGYAPQPNRSSVDVERNGYQPYQPQDHHSSPQEDYTQTPLVGGAPKTYQNMSEQPRQSIYGFPLMQARLCRCSATTIDTERAPRETYGRFGLPRLLAAADREQEAGDWDPTEALRW